MAILEEEGVMTKEKIDSVIGMIEAAGFPKQGSYRRREVCKILGISERSYWQLISEYERDPETGRPINPATLESFMLRRERRIRIDELADFMERNNTYDKKNSRI